jgi:2-keto-4-pentenoate hydratase/2-oxohepta-3-ene-1,7-dioic acid hydratase in catechol pathway
VDGDGIPNAVEAPAGPTGLPPDSDGDGLPDFRDRDADGDEIPDIDALELRLAVNGTVRQSSSTAHMIFKLPVIISYISRFMTLLPGDVVATGTPSGVGLGLKPPVFLKAGDEMELRIEGLGTQRQRVVEFRK